MRLALRQDWSTAESGEQPEHVQRGSERTVEPWPGRTFLKLLELALRGEVLRDLGCKPDRHALKFVAYYGVLSSMAERSPDVTAELQTVIDFMATAPRK